MLKKLGFFVLMLCLSSLLIGKNQKIDSLIQAYHGASNDSSKAAILNNLAWKFMFNNPDTTAIIARTAMMHAEKSKQLKLMVNAQNNEATSYAVKGLFDSSLVFFNKAKKFAIILNEPQELASVYNNIGLVFWNQGKLDSAVATYQKALAAYDRMDEIKANLAGTFNNLGLIYKDLGKFDLAIENYLGAVKIYDTLGIKSKGVADVLNNIGIIYEEKGRYPNALDYYLKSLKMYETIGDESAGYANVLSNIGIIYKEQKDYEKALSYYDKAKLAFEKIASTSVGLANTLNNIGIIYRLQGNENEALKFYQQALAMQEQMGEISIGMANSLTNIGTIKESQGKLEEAISFFMRSKEIQETIGDKIGYANSLFYIGNLKIENNNIREGIAQCKESYGLAQELDLLEIKMNACNCLADAYERSNNTLEAYRYFKLFVGYRDSLSNKENTKEITQKAMSYEFDKIQYQDSLRRAETEKMREIEQREKDIKKEAEIERQRVFTIAGGVGFLLMMGLAFVLFKGYKNKQKANEIITAQKEEVESQKQAVEEQKEIIEEKNREIVDSISYAKRIQQAILPSDKTMEEILPNSFVFFKPKDIVSGDFYWMDQKDGKSFFAAVDCTGHGVPGAMVSVVGHNGLNRVLNEFNLIEPAKMLDKLNDLVEETFAKSSENVKDGMDIAICCYDPKTKVLEYAGANNPLYLVRGEELIEYKADKQPIGEFEYRKPFNNVILQLEEGDSIYVFSDGFADQFGGEKGKKFMYKPFKRLLTDISSISIIEQKTKLRQVFDEWKGEIEQIDDVCVLGLKVT